MKVYIRGSETNKGYMKYINRYGNYIGWDSDGRRTLECIVHVLTETEACRRSHRAYINKPIKKIESDHCKVIAYTCTLLELQQTICTILKDASKQWNETLYPRIKGNQICYYTIPSTNEDRRYKMCITIDEINSKPAQRLAERWSDYQGLELKLCAISIANVGTEHVKRKSSSSELSFKDYIALLKDSLPKKYDWDYEIKTDRNGVMGAEFYATVDGEERVVGMIIDDATIKLDQSQVQNDIVYLMEELE